MNSEDKARLYDALVLEGDKINRRLSQLKSINIGGDASEENEKEMKFLKNQLVVLEDKLNNLVRGL